MISTKHIKDKSPFYDPQTLHMLCGCKDHDIFKLVESGKLEADAILNTMLGEQPIFRTSRLKEVMHAVKAYVPKPLYG